jgi:hypothetical protein
MAGFQTIETRPEVAGFAGSSSRLMKGRALSGCRPVFDARSSRHEYRSRSGRGKRRLSRSWRLKETVVRPRLHRDSSWSCTGGLSDSSGPQHPRPQQSRVAASVSTSSALSCVQPRLLRDREVVLDVDIPTSMTRSSRKPAVRSNSEYSLSGMRPCANDVA